MSNQLCPQSMGYPLDSVDAVLLKMPEQFTHDKLKSLTPFEPKKTQCLVAFYS